MWLEASPIAFEWNLRLRSSSLLTPHLFQTRQRRTKWRNADRMYKLRVSPSDVPTGVIFDPTAKTRHFGPQTRARATTGCRLARVLRLAVFTHSGCFQNQRSLKLREGFSGRVHLLCFLILALEEINKIITILILKPLNIVVSKLTQTHPQHFLTNFCGPPPTISQIPLTKA